MPQNVTTTWPQARQGSAVRLPGYAGHVVVASGLAWLVRDFVFLLAVAVASILFMLIIWRLTSRESFTRWVAGPVLSRYWRSRIRRRWAEVSDRCDLTTHGTTHIRRTRRRWPRIEMVVRPAVGQTHADFEKAAEAIRLAIGASQIRIAAVGRRDVSITFTIGNILSKPFDATTSGTIDQLDSVVLGRRSDGQDWRLPIGPHTLVAGSSGSGKGSLFWSFAFALAPAVHDGRVQLHGVDLKGGMEILIGADLFTTRATSATQAVVSLERLVDMMRERTRQYAGHFRSHQPTTDDPLHVLMIDELAALTAYCPNRELQRRAENAINLLCSQGRAPGFMVFACLQDPRKEVIPSRGLFTQMVGLRLKDASETSMVLGETAVISGAHCHRIGADVPGTGYVVSEDSGQPIRIRAGFASDEAIRAAARRFSTPVDVPIDATSLEYEVATRASYRTRPTGGVS